MTDLYQPREDSQLLLNQVKKHSKGLVLDIGTGSGIQALEAAKKNNVKSVVAADINKKTIQQLKKKYKNKKIKFIQNDLFSKINKKFDTIIFNPPYLPSDIKLKDLTLDGGKKGYETIEKFLNQVNKYLRPNGIILIVFSSLTKKGKIDEFIVNNMLEFELLDKKHIFFEDLYVYLIKKQKILQQLERRKIKNIKKLTKGHRGLIYTGNLKGKKIAIKIKNPESKAVGRIKNESNYLKLLNKHKIGSKLLFFSNDYFVYEFISGDFIEDFIKKSSKTAIIKVLKDVFNQMFVLDKLGINKEEMHHPVKHIIVSKKPVLVDARKSKISGISKTTKVVLIDFERCHKTLKPHNVTQFCQYIIKLSKLLKEKGIVVDKNKIIRLSKKYKKDMSRKNLGLVLNEIQ